MARKIEIVIAGDASGATRAADQAESRFSKMGKRFTDFGKKASLAMTLPVVAGAAVVFDKASDLNESMSKVEQVFGETSLSIKSFAKNAATNFGLSEQAALEATGTFGNLFRSMGVGIHETSAFSQTLVGLSADLASFNNADSTEVLDALRAGLLGEAEPLRKFGVSLSAARIEAEALATGLVKPVGSLTDLAGAQVAAEKANRDAQKALKAHGKDSLEYQQAQVKVAKAEERLQKALKGKVPELTAAQKAQAAYSVIMKDTALAQNDFARTADGAANKQRIMKAQFDNAAASLGQNLLPLGQKLIGWVTSLVQWFNKLGPSGQKIVLMVAAFAAAVGPLVTVVGGLISVIKGLQVAMAFLAANPIVLVIAGIAALAAGLFIAYKKSETFRNIVNAVARVVGGALTTAFRAVAGFITGKLVPAFQRIWGFLSQHIIPIIGAVISKWWAFHTAVARVVAGVIGKVAGVAANIRDRIGGAVNFIREKFQNARRYIGIIWDWIADKIAAVVRFVRNLIDKVAGPIGGLLDKIGSVGGAIGGIGGAIGGIFHGGGIVPGSSGQNVPIIARAGEGVFTQEQMAALGAGLTSPVSAGSSSAVTIDLRGAIVASAVDLERVIKKAIQTAVGRDGGIAGTNIVRTA